MEFNQTYEYSILAFFFWIMLALASVLVTLQFQLVEYTVRASLYQKYKSTGSDKVVYSMRKEMVLETCGSTESINHIGYATMSHPVVGNTPQVDSLAQLISKCIIIFSFVSGTMIQICSKLFVYLVF